MGPCPTNLNLVSPRHCRGFLLVSPIIPSLSAVEWLDGIGLFSRRHPSDVKDLAPRFIAWVFYPKVLLKYNTIGVFGIVAFEPFLNKKLQVLEVNIAVFV